MTAYYLLDIFKRFYYNKFDLIEFFSFNFLPASDTCGENTVVFNKFDLQPYILIKWMLTFFSFAYYQDYSNASVRFPLQKILHYHCFNYHFIRYLHNLLKYFTRVSMKLNNHLKHDWKRLKSIIYKELHETF